MKNAAFEFVTELVLRPSLASAIWPTSADTDFRAAFRNREQRRELLTSAMTLGHSIVDLWLLAARRLPSLRRGLGERGEDTPESLAEAFLDLLSDQRDQQGMNSWRELEAIGQNFELILNVNFPDLQSRPLQDLPGYYRAAMQRQTPVGGMWGTFNQQMVSQFRMPGYPYVLVTTDVVQEGEDLHTFCSRVVHYGITWTPSAMEQRTGRVDRIGSQAHRRLDGAHGVTEDDFLQVFFPYLADTVEIVQVQEVFRRMNRFLDLMHEAVQKTEADSSLIDLTQRIVSTMAVVPPNRVPLRSSFAIDSQLLEGGERRPAIPEQASPKETIDLFNRFLDGLSSTWAIEWVGRRSDISRSGVAHLAAGSVLRAQFPSGGTRRQAFHVTLRTSAIGGHVLLRCSSPVGKIARDDDRTIAEVLWAHQRLERAKLFASGRYINRNDGISRTATQIAQLNGVSGGFTPFDNEARGFVYVANGTVQLTDKHRIFGLVQYDSRTQGGNFQNYAGNFAPSQYGGGAYALRLTSVWSQRLTTRLLASYNNKGSNDNLDVIGGLGTKPEADVYSAVNKSAGRLVGNGLLGVLNNLGSRSTNPAHKSTFSGDLTYYVPRAFGSHEIQTGFYLQPRAAVKSTTYYANGGFTLEDRVLSSPSNYASQQIPFHRRYVTAPSNGLVTSYIGADDYALYIQDRWRPASRLAVTVGLRADKVRSRDELFHVITSNAWNFAPRFGGSFVLTSDQRHAVRGSWGRVTDIPNSSYLGTAGTSVASVRDEYDLDLNGSFETVFTTPGTTALSANKTIDPNRHQGYVQEWIAGYRGQLPGAFTLDISYIDRNYKDRPAQVDINQIYNGSVWAGLKDPTQNNIYLVTNNVWNWFVYKGIEFTATKQTAKLNLIATYTRAFDHIDGTWQPNDPAAFIQPGAFANDAGIGTVRGNGTNSLTGDTRNRMWQRHQFRTGVTWNAPWRLRWSNTFTAQSGTPSGPITTNIAAPDPQFGPTTLTINGRLVSNPLATTTRFYYPTRGEGQLWTPWLITWNSRLGREFKTGEFSSLEVAADFFNITNRGAAQQFVTGGNQINSVNYGGLQNIQTPRSAQFSARWRF